MSFVSQVISSARPILWFPIALNTLVVSTRLGADFYIALMLSISLCLASSFGFVINDLTDTIEDEANKASRLQRITLSQRNLSLGAAIGFAICSISFAAYCGTIVAFFMIGIIALLKLYSSHARKRFIIANFLAASLSASPIWLPLVSFHNHGDTMIQGIILFAILLLFAREIVFDAEDVIGDRIAGRKTFATIYGPRKSVFISIWLQSVVLITFAIIGLLKVHGQPLMLWVAVACFGAFISIALLSLLRDLNLNRVAFPRYTIFSRIYLVLLPLIIWFYH